MRTTAAPSHSAISTMRTRILVALGSCRVQVWHRFDQTGNPNPVKVFDDGQVLVP